MRRLILYCFTAFLIGIVLFNYTSYYLIGAASTALFLFFFIKKYKYFGLFLLIFLFLGAAVAWLHTVEFDNAYNRLVNLNCYEGYIIDKSNNSFTVKNYSANYKVVLSLNSESNARPGDYIRFSGKVSQKPEYKRKILNSLGINAYISNSDNNIAVRKGSSLFLLPVQLKYKISTGLSSVDRTGGSFISGLITGYTSDMKDDVKNDFNDLGISHILAVSGYNIGIIFYFMMLITKKLSAKNRYILILSVCLTYTAIGGFEPSLLRAFLMISIVIASKLFNRLYDVVSGITLSAFIMLLMNSYYLFNIGFLLSYFATYGIILLNKDIEDRLPQKLNKIKGEIAVALSAFIATLPLILWYKGYFSIISIIVNIIVSPIVAFTTILSFISAVLYSLLTLKFILYPAVLIGDIFIKIAALLNKYNFMVYPGQPSMLFIFSYYIFIGSFFGYIKINTSKTKKRIINASLIMIMLLTLLIHRPYLKIHFINVGQGDSTFIETPDRKTILIDTGPAYEDFSALKARILPYVKRAGYNKIDLLIITHFHNDHCGDYKYLLDNYKVGKLITFRSPEDSSYKFTEVSKGDKIKIGNFIMDILFPVKDLKNYDDKNETCIVLCARYRNFSMLLTADADKQEMDTIKGDFDVFRVPHHGSVKSLSYDFLNDTAIGTAVISVGKNSFGHPSGLVLAALQKKNIKTYRTDYDGNITVITQGESYRVLLK